MHQQTTKGGKSDSTCAECFRFAACGGVEGMLGIAGCNAFTEAECNKRGWTDFRNTKEFAIRWSETGGFDAPFAGNLTVPNSGSLPHYAPTIYHGYSRHIPLQIKWAAVPLYAILRTRKDGTFGLVVNNNKSLHEHFQLADTTRIIVTSVAPDGYLEKLWSNHQILKVGELLSSLKVDAVTFPNFSFFSDAPLVHAAFNRARMLRIAERFSAAGVPLIPHLMATSERHWRFWEQFLKEQPQVSLICKEFQTGLRAQEAGAAAYERIVRLQENVGRELHPVLIAGQRFLRKLPLHFGSRYTIIDAVPFLKTYHRQWLREGNKDGFRWEFKKTQTGEQLDDRLLQTICRYEAKLSAKAAGQRWVQSELSLRGFLGRQPKVLPKQESFESMELCKSPGLPIVHSSPINNVAAGRVAVQTE